MGMKCGSRRIEVAVTNGKAADDAAKATQDREEAETAEDQANEAAEREQAIETAHGMRKSASESSKKAFGGSDTKAHSAAAIAHTDAASAYKKIAGASSGYDLKDRTEAKRRANEHQTFAERHGAIGEGQPDPAAVYKSKRVLNAGRNSGSIQVTSNVLEANAWSDEARAASAAARRAGAHADATDTITDHAEAALAHDKAASLTEGAKASYHTSEANRHTEINRQKMKQLEADDAKVTDEQRQREAREYFFPSKKH